MIPGRLPRRARWLAAAVATAALCGPLLAACGGSSSSNPSPASQAAGPVTTKARATATSKPSAPATATTAAASSVSQSCPPASVVNAALAQSNGAPASAPNPFGLTCVYKGAGAVATKIQFQKDTAATFAAGENAVATTVVKPVSVSGLGESAYTMPSGGFLDVFTGSESIKITSPLSTTAQLEALARQIMK